jgi:hypothetical protein
MGGGANFFVDSNNVSAQYQNTYEIIRGGAYELAY